MSGTGSAFGASNVAAAGASLSAGAGYASGAANVVAYPVNGFVTPINPLPIDEDDGLNDFFQSVVAAITALDPTLVRPRWQVIPPPEPAAHVNWCAIGTQTTTPDDSPYMNGRPDGLTQDFKRFVMIDVMASFFGPAARTYAGILRDGLSVAQNKDVLNAAGIGLHSVGQTIFVPDVIGMEWRARCDLIMSFTREIDRVYSMPTYVDPPLLDLFTS